MDEPIRVHLHDGEQPAILQDMSSGGACVRTHQRLRVGDHLMLRMHFGSNQHYDIRARVVYAHPGRQGFHSRYGLRFIALRNAERVRLDSFVNDRMASSHFGLRAYSTTPTTAHLPRS